jgi:hypothetical protein
MSTLAPENERTPDSMPVQIHYRHGMSPRLGKEVVMRAYEVYSHIYGPQEAMVTGGCRGGFGFGELVAFLYARSFPKEEWRKRADEAFRLTSNFP